MYVFLHISVASKMYDVKHCFYFISCDFLDDRSGCDMLLDWLLDWYENYVIWNMVENLYWI